MDFLAIPEQIQQMILCKSNYHTMMNVVKAFPPLLNLTKRKRLLLRLPRKYLDRIDICQLRKPQDKKKYCMHVFYTSSNDISYELSWEFADLMELSDKFFSATVQHFNIINMEITADLLEQLITFSEIGCLYAKEILMTGVRFPNSNFTYFQRLVTAFRSVVLVLRNLKFPDAISLIYMKINRLIIEDTPNLFYDRDVFFYLIKNCKHVYIQSCMSFQIPSQCINECLWMWKRRQIRLQSLALTSLESFDELIVFGTMKHSRCSQTSYFLQQNGTLIIKKVQIINNSPNQVLPFFSFEGEYLSPSLEWLRKRRPDMLLDENI